MKSDAVYQGIREVFGPWAKDQRFKRTKGGLLGWYRSQADGYLVFWFQCSRDGWDAFAGSKFVLEFEFSQEPQPGVGTRRERFSRLLDASQRERMRMIQNEIIAKLPAPPGNHPALKVDSLAQYYRNMFAQVLTPYSERQDVWLRYQSEGDVHRWADFLLPEMPTLLSRFLSLATELK